MPLLWANSVPPSPYLAEPGRLGDVIAAIQAMATYKFYKLTHEDWADRIAADKTQGDKWKRIFEQHPGARADPAADGPCSNTMWPPCIDDILIASSAEVRSRRRSDPPSANDKICSRATISSQLGTSDPSEGTSATPRYDIKDLLYASLVFWSMLQKPQRRDM